MTRSRFLFTWLAAVGTGLLSAQDKPTVGAPYTPPSDLKGAWAFQSDRHLPNVLILGDSISIGYTLPVRAYSF